MDENEAFRAWVEQPGHETEAQLVRCLRAHAHAVCWLVLQEHAEAVVNEAVAEVLLNGQRFRGDSKFSTWFQAMVQNMCADYLRQKVFRRATEVSLEEGADNHWEIHGLETGDKGDGLTGRTIGEQLAVRTNPDSAIYIAQLTQGLRDDERELVRRRLEGQTLAEITAAMGLGSEEAAKKWWTRTRNKILGRLARRTEAMRR